MLTKRMAVGSAGFGGSEPGFVRCTLLLDSHEERGAAVEPAGFLARVVVFWTLFTVADRAQSVGADAVLLQVLADRVRTPLAERQVVFGCADVAGVAFDLEPEVRVLLQRSDRF